MGDYDEGNDGYGDGEPYGGGGGHGRGGGNRGRQSGGGWVDDGVQASQSQAGGAGKTTKNKEAQSVCPLTIKQLLEAEKKADNNFKIDGKTLSQLTFVGQVQSVDIQQTYINYNIDDSTGQIAVKLFIDSDNPESKTSDIREGSYVRVFGNLRPTPGGQSVVGFQLVPVVDFNEITFHYLEVIAVHLRNRASSSGSSSSSHPGGVHVKPEPRAGSSSYNSAGAPHHHHNHGAPAAAAAGVAGGVGQDDWTPLRRSVLAEFEKDQSESGATVEEVATRLQVSAASVKDEVTFFCEEGHLYSTVDDDHFKSTSGQ